MREKPNREHGSGVGRRVGPPTVFWTSSTGGETRERTLATHPIGTGMTERGGWIFDISSTILDRVSSVLDRAWTRSSGVGPDNK